MQQRWHHYNVAFVDENVDTKELLNFLVENVVINRLSISLLKRWQLYMYEKRKWFEFIKITLTLIFHPYHFCGSNNFDDNYLGENENIDTPANFRTRTRCTSTSQYQQSFWRNIYYSNIFLQMKMFQLYDLLGLTDPKNWQRL